MSVLENIKTRLAVIVQQKEEMVESLRNDFAPMFKELFDKSNGKINSIGWKQYSPYFNDGEECIFSVKADLDYGITVNGECLDDSELITIDVYTAQKILRKDGSYEKWIAKYPEYKIDIDANKDQLELVKILVDASNLLYSIPEDFMKDLFGNHVEVTIKSDGTIETEGYEHD